jgi:hypothetical protein
MAGTGGWRRHLKSFSSWGWRFSPGPAPAVTMELPLTPAHVFALRHHVRSERQWLIGAVAAGATFALLLSALPFSGRPIPFLIYIYIAAFVVGVGLIFDWLGWRRAHEADLRKGIYYRVSGRSASIPAGTQVGLRSEM